MSAMGVGSVSTWNPISAIAQSFKEGWEWWTGGFANSTVYEGVNPPTPGPAPSVPSSALHYPYQPTPEEITAAQTEGLENWRVNAIPSMPKVEDNTLVYAAVGLGVLLVIMKR